ncbi:MAG: biotin--[acetyl-CoA-carboxylase] ligase [Candidatus Cloacimonas sp.]|nr:biotin--[acetyl-CoA-carboxylase] ligase [Candidatus Cloacimonadota bacterium]
MSDIPFFDQVIRFNSLQSTHTQARKLIFSREVKGNFLVIANSQSSGAGRKDSPWHSPAGGLWFTAGFYNLPLRSSLTIYLAVIITKAFETLYPELSGKIKIKWPNDLYINDKKFCGILTTSFPDQQYIISGIGLNTNVTEFPEHLKERATSLSLALYKELDNNLVLNTIFDIFAQELPDYLENELTNQLSYYKNNSYLYGREIILGTEFEKYTGLVKGINRRGALLLQLDNESIQPFYSGSILEIK